MIKARGKTALGHDFVMLGLSGENVTRLVAGEPIKLNLSELGLPAIEVGIVYGKTEDDIAADLRAYGVRLNEG